MESVVFQVSAKTARLIGRENISDVDGAIVELVKNGYDADAECVFIKYVNPYNTIPKELTLSEVKNSFCDDLSIIKKHYEVINGKYVLKEKKRTQKDDINEENKDAESERKLKYQEDMDELKQLFCSRCEIIVLDNGCGMNQETLKTSWMNIGTNDKEINVYSKEKNRVKTGAKGIGRFALDKLSLKSTVITKSKDDDAINWEIDWVQFDNVELLNQVKADINILHGGFTDIIKDVLGEDFELVKDYDWSTGTLIKLCPIREFWNSRLYKKVNDNLKNINPLGSVDKFDIIVKNLYYPDLNYQAMSEGINREDYDYLIEAEYDGDNKVKITLDRNELDIDKKVISVKYSEEDKEVYDLEEFWNREVFNRDQYRRCDFKGRTEFEYVLEELVANDDMEYESYKQVGPFKLQIYYLKNMRSTVEIVRDFKSRRRKKLLNDFGGIKIYRDNFKVRPYGEGGQFYDWINLSKRVQMSPAAASHESGSWRVSPNQIIGSVSISRISNPKLEDNANREGMSLNREYDAFVELIKGIISKFEFDRQYPLREYGNWINNKKKAHANKIQQIYEQVKREKESKRENARDAFSQKIQYTEDELKDAVYTIGKEKADELSTKQLLMVLSAAGVMAQTFSHEITRVATNLGSRGQHLKVSIDRLLNYESYTGDEDFNPYDMLDELNDTDELLSEWVNLIMDSVKKENFNSKSVDLVEFLHHIKEIWEPLLEKKYIKICLIESVDNAKISLPEVDLHLVVNNFLLNSAYYLEEASSNREIVFKVYEDDKYIYLDMKNNGPELDIKYRQNPDEALEAQESSKEEGTGLGLWIARQAMNRNSGNLHIILIEDGFLLRAAWLK